ncbi:MAG: FAD-dependent oxidoreductase [Solirubrobacteraceae bacterium]
MEGSQLRVLIAGGGVAGLETLLALRGLAGERAVLAVTAPEDEFVYRPIAVEQHSDVGRLRSIPLAQAAQDAGAAFVSGMLEDVDAGPGEGEARLSTGEVLNFDALVLAVGAEAMPALDHVMTWDDRSDAEMLGGLLRDIEQGYTRRVAVVIPPGPGWPLRGYELALLLARHAQGMSVELETTMVGPQTSPLALLGDHAVQVIAAELKQAGVAVASTRDVTIERDHHLALILHPSGRRLEVDRVLAMPILRGRTIEGIPAEEHGLIAVDEHCRVIGLERVWAVGDCTAFPLKSGGISAAQADIAAEQIASLAGADLQPRAFAPKGEVELAGLPAGRFLEEWLAAEEPGLAMHLPTAGVPVLTYLRKDLAAGWRGYG